MRCLWPQRGWKRAFKYYWYRFTRTRGSAHAVANGFAIGFSVSFTPLMGLHVLLTLFICWTLRANYVAALIGTLVFNPVTALPILAFVYEIGLATFHFLGIKEVSSLPGVLSPGELFRTAITNFPNVFLPWLTGGVLVAICLYPFAYKLGMILVRLKGEFIDKRRESLNRPSL